MFDIFQCNVDLENGQPLSVSDAELLSAWMWETDPGEELNSKVLLNTNQLVGLLYCRKLAQSVVTNASQQAPVTLQENMQMTDTTPDKMTLRQLLDTVDNICIEWPKFIKKQPNPLAPENQSVFSYVDSCFSRFGLLSMYAYDKDVLDDLQLTEEYNETHRKITLGCIRRFLNAFLILYRHFYLFTHAQRIDAPFYNCNIRAPHMEASMENFDLLCMHISIPVGARLRYKNDFRGMYNHISQVMFFHNPLYDRAARIEWNKINASTDAIQVLPALIELQPDIAVQYEEDHFMHQPLLENWTWLLVSGRVYLLQPDKKILYSDDVTTLFELFLKNKKD
jgi:hypothetical protein